MELSRNLVTTADERTWPIDHGIIFLGKWCLNHERRHIWNELNFILASSPDLETHLKNKNNKKFKEIENEFFHFLVQILNQHHKVSFSDNYWQILIGPWFESFLRVIIERKNRIEDVISSHLISGANFIEIKDVDLIPKDFSDALYLFKSDSFISSLDLLLVTNMDNINFPINKIPSSIQRSNISRVPLKISLIKKFFKTPKICFSKIANRLVRSNEPFISSTYLPLKEEIKLQLLFKQFPKIWRKYLTFEVKTNPDIELRHLLLESVKNHANLGIIAELVLRFIPVCYLEGYTELSIHTQGLRLPKRPKFIFTSNDFAVHEVFKLYAANCTENNVKYFIGQHGSTYGTNKYFSPSLEEKTPTKFLTWGWGENSCRYIPAFVFKVAGLTPKFHEKGGLLLVQFPIGHEIVDFYSLYDIDLYFQEQVKFIEGISSNIRKLLTIKLHPGSPDNLLSIENQFKSIHEELVVEPRNIDVRKIIAKNRLTVFSYDSTGLLENLALNIPTLAFWQFGLNHLTEGAKVNYQILVDVGIIHFSAGSVTEKINQVWNDIESWWQSTSVQSAREIFCSHYARTSSKPIRDLYRILIENSMDN